MSKHPGLKWTLVSLLVLALAIGLARDFGLIHLRGRWMYQAQAHILFSPIKFSDTGPTMMFGFPDYLADQCARIQSKREISLALQEQPWKSTGKGASDEIIKEFSSKLTVESNGGLVTITYLDENKETALAAVQATVRAYRSLYAESDPEHTKDILTVLDVDRQGLQNNISSLTDQRKRVCGDTIFNPETLERYYISRVDEFIKAEDQRLELALQTDTLRASLKNRNIFIPADLATNDPLSPPPATQMVDEAATRAALLASPASAPQTLPRPTPESIAQHDQYMEALLNQLRTANAALVALQKTGIPAKSPQVNEAQQRVDTIQTAIDQYFEELGGNDPELSTDPRLAELETSVHSYRQLLDLTARLKIEAQDLGAKVTQLHKIQEQESDYKNRLDSVNAKIDRLNNDLQLAKRADFLTDGDDAGQALVQFENTHWTKLGPTRP